MQTFLPTRHCMTCLALLTLALACNRRASSSAAPPPPAEARIGARSVVEEARGWGTPVELLTDASSPYVDGLVLDGDVIYLLTDRVAYRIVPGSPTQRIAIENGIGAAVTRTDLVYWSKGAIWAQPKTGGQARRLATLAHQPQSFMAVGDDLAWLDMPSQDHFVIQTLVGHDVRTLFFHPGRIETAAMDNGQVFFVRRESSSSWRIGSVAVRGGELKQGALHTGPTPAKLAVAGDVFYYDLDSGEIRRVSADLAHEEALTKNVICSPLAVATQIVCPNIEGLFVLDRQPGAKATLLVPDRRRIAAVAANARFTVWLSDAGPDRLSLMMMPLGG